MPDIPLCRLRVCTHLRTAATSASCAARGARHLIDLLRAEAEAGTLPALVEETVCLGHCDEGPNAKVIGGPLLHGLSSSDTMAIRRAVHATLAARRAAATGPGPGAK